MPTKQLPHFSSDELQIVKKGEIREVEMPPPTSGARGGITTYLVRVSNNIYENGVSGDRFQIDITTPANVDHDAVRDGMLIGARVASGQGNEQSASSKGDRTSGVGTVATPRFSTQEVEDIINIHFQFLHNVKKDETTSGQIPSKEPCTIEFSIDTDTKQIYGEEAPGSPTGAGQRSGHPFGVSSRRINYEFERFCIWMNANLTASEIENGTVGIIILDKDDPAWSAETEDRNLLFVTKASPSTSITKTVTSATTLRLIAKVSGSAKYNLTGKYRRQTG